VHAVRLVWGVGVPQYRAHERVSGGIVMSDTLGIFIHNGRRCCSHIRTEPARLSPAKCHQRCGPENPLGNPDGGIQRCWYASRTDSEVIRRLPRPFGFGASSSTLSMVLPVNGNEAAIAYAAIVSRRTIDPTRVALAFVSRRFADVPAGGANPLAVGYADALFICSLDGPRGDVVKARQQQLSPLHRQSGAARPGPADRKPSHWK
jgi:hypothetical protein